MIKFLKHLFKPKICNHPSAKGYIVKCDKPGCMERQKIMNINIYSSLGDTDPMELYKAWTNPQSAPLNYDPDRPILREWGCFCKYPSEQLIAQDQLIYFPGMAACLKLIDSDMLIQLYQCQQCKNTTRMFLKKIAKSFNWYYC